MTVDTFVDAMGVAIGNQEAMTSVDKLQCVVLPVLTANYGIAEDVQAELERLHAQSGGRLEAGYL